MSSNFNIINMDSFDAEIIRLKARITLLENIAIPSLNLGEDKT